jgi:hypothetical protein
MYNYHSNYLTFGKRASRMNYVRVCSREVGYHTDKVIKGLWNAYYQACQVSFINKGSKGSHCMLSCNPDRRHFHVMDHIHRLAVACRNFSKIMSRGVGIMLAILVLLFDFHINPRALRAILLICQAHILWGSGSLSSSWRHPIE